VGKDRNQLDRLLGLGRTCPCRELGNGSGRIRPRRQAAHLDRVGIAHEDPQDATAVRILPLQDPDGNRIVFIGAFSAGEGAQ
jgi:hypothetical protein